MRSLSVGLLVVALLSLVVIGALLVLLSSGKRPTKTRKIPSSLGVSPMRKHGKEEPFSQSDLADINQMLLKAEAQENTLKDDRLLGVLNGLVNKRIKISSVQEEEGSTLLRFVDGTGVVLSNPTSSISSLSSLNSAFLSDVSYTAPIVLLSFNNQEGKELKVGAKAALK